MSLQFTTTSTTTPLFKLSRLKTQLLLPEKKRNALAQLAPELTDIPFDKAEMQSA
jgi:hypothetical protein